MSKQIGKKQEITVRYVPNIFEKTGRTVHKAPYNAQKSLYTTLYECYKGKVLPDNKNPFKSHRIIVNGVKIEKENLKKTFLWAGDEIIVTPEVQEVFTLAIIGGLIGGAVGGWTLSAIMLGFAIGGLIGGIIFPPHIPKTEFDTPTYSWDGMKSDVSPEQPVPIIFGEHRVPIRIINAFTSNQIQFDYNWATVVPSNRNESGYVNTFTIEAHAIKFYTVPYAVKAMSSGDLYYYPYLAKNLQRGISSYQSRRLYYVAPYLEADFYSIYKVEYKLSSASTWTVWGYAITAVQIDFDEYGEYDIRITLLADNILNLPNNTRYWIPYTIGAGAYPIYVLPSAGIQAKIATPSTTEPDNSYLWALGVIGEGEIDFLDKTSIEINNNPIYNFDSQTIDIETRLGTNDQTAINGFNDTHSIQSIGINLLKDEPYTWTTVNDDIEAFEINFSLGGLYHVQNDGDVISLNVQYRVEYRLTGNLSWIDLGIVRIDAKQQSAFTKKFRKDNLTAGKYDIRVTRISDNPDFTHVSSLILSSISEITYDKFRYPNTTLVAIKMLATDRLSGSMPNMTIMCRGLKCRQPKIVDGGGNELAYNDYYYDWDAQEYKSTMDGSTATWDGITWVDKWTANPIWCLYELIRHTRYGLGKHFSTYISVSTLVEMANWCDVYIPTEETENMWEKRFQLDLAIDSSERAIDLLNSIASTFRGYVFTSEGYAKIIIDKPEDPVQMFTMGNILAKNGKSTFQEAFASMKATPNIVEVQYANAQRNYERDIVAFENSESLAAGDPIKKTSLSLFGITRTSQAMRMAKRYLMEALYCKRTAGWGVGIDGVACSVGDVINFQHDVPFWSNGGRVKNSGGGIGGFVIDEPIILASGGSYEAKLRFSDDSIETRDVISPAGEYSGGSIINVTPDFSQVPQQFDIWAVGREDLCTKPFRLLAIQRDKINEVTLSGLEYNETVYDDVTGIILPTPDYTDFIPNAPVTDLALSERLIKMGDGTIETAIDVAFAVPLETIYAGANIYISTDDGGSWEHRGFTKNGTFVIIGGIADGTTYTVAVATINKLNQELRPSMWTTAEITIVGKSALPENVTGFTVTQNYDRLRLSHNAVSDVDLDYYETRRGTSWENGIIIERTAKTAWDLLIFPFGSQTYYVKARDTSGNYSEIPAVAGIAITDIPGRQSLFAVIDNLEGEIGAGLDWEYIDSDGIKFRKCILLQTQRVWDEDSKTWDEVESEELRYDYPVEAEGYYTMPVQDVGLKLVSYVSVSAEVESDGEEATYTIQVRYSDDNITFTAWEDLPDTILEFRYIQFRIKLETSDENKNIRYFGLEANIDVPEVIERFSNVAIEDTGTDIVFTKDFHTAELAIVVTPIDNPYTPYLTDITADGCKIYLRNTETGALAAGTVNIIISGF